MHLLWLAKVEDDTIFIITLGVVLLVVISYLVLGRDDTIRLQEEETSKTNESEHQKNVIHRLDRANDLLTSIRNSILILIVLIVLLPVLFLLLTKSNPNLPLKQAIPILASAFRFGIDLTTLFRLLTSRSSWQPTGQ